MKKKSLLALLLVLVLLLQACGAGVQAEPRQTEPWPFGTTAEQTTQEPEPTTEQTPADTTREATSSEPEPTEPASPEHTPYEDYERRYEPYLEQVPFGEIPYERVDAQGLIHDFNEVAELAASEVSVNELIGAYEEVYEDYLYFYTMTNLVYILHTLDLNDAYYEEENAWYEEQGPLVNQALELCYVAMGDSQHRDALERRLFEPGFFEFYDENQIYSNDRVVELMQREAELTSDYMALMSDMTIPWEGEEVLFDEVISSPYLSQSEYLDAYEIYYDKYTPLCAEIYVELIKVRNAIAEELEYDSYADFAYSYTYERDYTPEEGEAYLNDIARYMTDLYYVASMNSYSYSLDPEEVKPLLGQIAYEFGGDIATAYDFMVAYDLYDITDSTSKMPGSYMTYLPSYEMPFVYISPTGTSSDIFTAVHEFGHFADGFVNCNETTSIDCAEIFSQALEFLALDSQVFSPEEREQLHASHAANAVMTFLSQACYAKFEHMAFAADPDTLDAETLNALFYQAMEDYGMAIPYLKEIMAPFWMDVMHFFIAPYYVISYCTSLDAALQVYQCELEQGTGLETYYRLLEASSGASLVELLEHCGIATPFDGGRVKELADFLADQLY